MHHHSKSHGRKPSEEILGQSKTKTQLGNSTLCVSMFDITVFFKTPTPFSFVDGNQQNYSLELVPHSVCSSPWQVYNDSDITNILGVSSKMQASPSQLHTIASLGLHAGIPRQVPDFSSLP